MRAPEVGDVVGSPPDRYVCAVSRDDRTFRTQPASFHPLYEAAPIEPGWAEQHDASARGIDCTEDPVAHLREAAK